MIAHDTPSAGAAAPPLLDRLGALSLSNGLRLTREPRRGRQWLHKMSRLVVTYYVTFHTQKHRNGCQRALDYFGEIIRDELGLPATHGMTPEILAQFSL